MKSTSQVKYVFIIALLLMAAAVSWQFHFSDFVQKETVNIHNFPMTIGNWSGEEIPISENDLAILETKNAFTRMYTTPDGKEVVLFIVYSQSNRKVSHPPEICYTGGGISILSNELRYLSDPARNIRLETHRMFVEKGPYQQVANYWFKVGDSYTANYLKQQFLIAVKTFLRKPASSALIRVSVNVQDEDVPLADATVREFALEILPILPQYLL